MADLGRGHRGPSPGSLAASIACPALRSATTWSFDHTQPRGTIGWIKSYLSTPASLERPRRMPRQTAISGCNRPTRTHMMGPDVATPQRELQCQRPTRTARRSRPPSMSRRVVPGGIPLYIWVVIAVAAVIPVGLYWKESAVSLNLLPGSSCAYLRGRAAGRAGDPARDRHQRHPRAAGFSHDDVLSSQHFRRDGDQDDAHQSGQAQALARSST